MFRASVLFSLTVVCASLQAQTGSRADLSRLVVVGDSISAGVQNFSLLDTQQVHGYASVIAAQANVSLVLPSVPYPGAPNVLQLTSLNPVTIAPVSGSLTAPRDNPCQQATNVSVPGVTLEQALTVTPNPAPSADPVQGWANIVLGFPSPFGAGLCSNASATTALTEVQEAVNLNPTAIIEWLGNNDVLVPALTGALTEITPPSTFANEYEQLLSTLQATHARILTTTIPDVTKIPYFTSLNTISEETHMSVGTVAQKLGLNPGDLLRETAVPTALSILSGQPAPSTWPASCPAPPLDLPSPVPCVLSASDASNVQNIIDSYNWAIVFESLIHGATVVDIHGLVDELAQDGYWAGDKHVTLAFLGGIVSLDGIHPTNKGYAIIANEFIEVMNAAWGTQIPPANVAEIAAHDPLVPPIKVPTNP